MSHTNHMHAFLFILSPLRLFIPITVLSLGSPFTYLVCHLFQIYIISHPHLHMHSSSCILSLYTTLSLNTAYPLIHPTLHRAHHLQFTSHYTHGHGTHSYPCHTTIIPITLYPLYPHAYPFLTTFSLSISHLF